MLTYHKYRLTSLATRVTLAHRYRMISSKRCSTRVARKRSPRASSSLKIKYNNNSNQITCIVKHRVASVSLEATCRPRATIPTTLAPKKSLDRRWARTTSDTWAIPACDHKRNHREQADSSGVQMVRVGHQMQVTAWVDTTSTLKASNSTLRAAPCTECQKLIRRH